MCSKSFPFNFLCFRTIDEHSVIREIMVCSNPDPEYLGDINNISFSVGGIYKPSVSLSNQDIDIWGGVTGNILGPINVDQLKVAQVCYYGSVPLNPDHDTELGTKKYLALKIVE